MIKINAHIHSPYSFSSFSDMEQAFQMAVDEDVKVLGINDFNVTDGYDEFYRLSQKYNIHPLFNIELIALCKDMQHRGIRVNDPANPGRVYLCGKGLSYPSRIEGKSKDMLENVKAESQKQIVEMIEKLNVWLKATGLDELSLDFTDVRARFARLSVRERHIAQALRTAIFERYSSNEERAEVLQKIYGAPSAVDIGNISAIDNELRNNLLKAGKKAFVAEDERAFLSIEQACEIIISAGGIPCYPVLLDGAAGKITEFEADPERLYQQLTQWGINCMELIPHRNKIELMEPFVRFFYDKGFSITFGTEHNTPAMLPVTPYCSGGVPLNEFLMQVNYEGAKRIGGENI